VRKLKVKVIKLYQQLGNENKINKVEVNKVKASKIRELENKIILIITAKKKLLIIRIFWMKKKKIKNLKAKLKIPILS
jgi:hypothetical protein